ncbi:hypothetical protein ABEB36_005236 [Hypothenemus hampei]|uniref:(3R)-3-hydroxyacyl-CoA dehydrogenase n=1 Tax=Hypothenemus hampei TaxID=57062 RepID=A0ABD1EXL8_HYPHA
MSLQGRLAFITGAGSGIGRATCQCLAREGATIVAADQNFPKVQETLKLLNPQEKHSAMSLSVENKHNIQEVLNNIIKTYLKPPSIVVNAAGITRDNFLQKLSDADFAQVLDVNLKGTFFVLQTFANSLVEHKINEASIINIGSIVAKFGNIGQANYCASKAGVEAMTKVAAKEYGSLGIRVNTIIPGMIVTPMTAAVPEKVMNKFKAMIPLGRFGLPEEVAEVITFLASTKSSYINGASIEVTGGF